MNGSGSDPDRKSRRGGTRGDAGRAERLARELRENLKRRKSQERARAVRDADEEMDRERSE